MYIVKCILQNVYCKVYIHIFNKYQFSLFRFCANFAVNFPWLMYTSYFLSVHFSVQNQPFYPILHPILTLEPHTFSSPIPIDNMLIHFSSIIHKKPSPQHQHTPQAYSRLSSIHSFNPIHVPDLHSIKYPAHSRSSALTTC